MISFLFNRARRHWQVLSTVLFGVLVSTALLTCEPMIVNTVMDYALPHILRASLNENGTIYLTTYNNQGSEVYGEIISDFVHVLHENIGDLSEVVNSVETSWVFPGQEDMLSSDEKKNFDIMVALKIGLK